MKILLLNPSIDAEHKIAKALQEQGMALLFPEDVTEAIQLLKLHGASVDLALVHREGMGGKGTPGLTFLEQAKRDPNFADLPVILTSEVWGDAECAEHQQSPLGANAYLRWPVGSEQITEVVKAIVGEPEMPKPPKTEHTRSSSGLVLEDASLLFSKPETTETSIRLDAPEFEASSPSLGKPAEVVLPAAPESSLPTAEFEQSKAAELSSIAIELPEVQEIKIEANEAQAEPQLVETSAPKVEVLDEPEIDVGIEQDMPYLFQTGGGAGIARRSSKALENFPQPVGDAVVPGGAAQSPDTETLKKYLLLREQDVAALSAQLKDAREQVVTLEENLRLERGRNGDLEHTVEEQRRRIEGFEKEKNVSFEALQGEVENLKFQLKTKTDKARLMEVQVREAADEMERLKERVRVDIRKIRVREKELENRLEIMKKDSEALIGARETKIIELKRKLDLLEFNMDLLQDQHAREKEQAAQLKERLLKAAQVVRVAGGLLEDSSMGSENKESDSSQSAG